MQKCIFINKNIIIYIYTHIILVYQNTYVDGVYQLKSLGICSCELHPPSCPFFVWCPSCCWRRSPSVSYFPTSLWLLLDIGSFQLMFACCWLKTIVYSAMFDSFILFPDVTMFVPSDMDPYDSLCMFCAPFAVLTEFCPFGKVYLHTSWYGSTRSTEHRWTNKKLKWGVP